MPGTFQELVQAADAVPYSFPLSTNRLKKLVQPPLNYDPKVIERQAAGVRPIIAEAVVPLAKAFLEFHREFGSPVEQEVYRGMSLEAFFDKLLRKRPLAFLTSGDHYLLRDGTTSGSGGFEAIGTESEQAPLLLREYNSYAEMQIATLMGVSVPTYFINQGDRSNRGAIAEKGSFEEQGIYTGLVGARFERKRLMESQHLLITINQNTPENGYGEKADPKAQATRALAHWAAFYGEGNFLPDYAAASLGFSNQFSALPTGIASYLNKKAFKHRMRVIVEPFLIDANARAAAAGTTAYIIAVGYGLGVWALPMQQDMQAQLLVEAFADTIAENTLPHISDLCFCWYPQSITHCGGTANDKVLERNGNRIRIHFNKENPMKKLAGPHAGKLLVASYAWDGNSYPGNEYWQGSLAASGDPAAACCSTIGELQNPDVNPAMNGSNVYVACRGERGLVRLKEY